MTWEFDLAPDADSVATARDYVRACFSKEIDADKMGCVELVVSELVTNSVRHGPGEPIKLRLASDGSGGVVGEVEDHGDGVVAIRATDVGTAVGGLGLPLVDELTSAWGVYPGSTHVWFRFE